MPSSASSTWKEPATPNIAFIQDALEEDPNIKCVSMYVDNQYDARPRLHRIDNPARGFPTTREELLSYDVVICSDIARAAFTAEQLEWTVELVSKRGGGFVMIGGNTSFGSGGWDQTVWDGLIPVDMSGQGPGTLENHSGSFRVVIPPQAVDHPIWRIVDDPDRNREVLAPMPDVSRHEPDRPAQAGRDGTRAFGGAASRLRRRDRLLLPDLRPRAHIRHGDRLDRRLGNRLREELGRRRQPLLPQVLAKRRPLAHRESRREPAAAARRNRQGHLSPGPGYLRSRPRPTTKSWSRPIATAWPPVFEPRASPESRPFDETAQNLVPQLNDLTYQGKLATPQPIEIMEDAGPTLHKLMLDVAALDGERIVAKSSIELQVIDDPAEFRDPRPDHAAAHQARPRHGGNGDPESGGSDDRARPAP